MDLILSHKGKKRIREEKLNLENIKKGIKYKGEANKSRKRKTKRNVWIARERCQSSNLVLQLWPYISSRIFDNQSKKIYGHLSEKASKDRLFGPDWSSWITLTKEKGRSKRLSEEEERRRREKGHGCTLSFFIMATLETAFGRKKKTVGRTDGLFGGKVIKNPARYIITQITTCRNVPWSNTQIPNCKNTSWSNSQTRENSFM